ncbi:MAG TPA: D-aminoacyl-tRNA deacylase [Dehalococcoidia bacterium]|nr:D-aminoacyl-tRNA deacylase [Dehalococcoidia bacterium]
MRVVLQRVTSAAVRVGGETVGAIGPGLVAFVGVAEGDAAADARRLATKTAELRIFSDAEGRFNLSLLEAGGEALVISQFTLHADTRRGRRPSFAAAARPEIAEPLVEAYASALEACGVRVARGRFGAHMSVDVFNDGPVTIILDSEDLDRPRRSKA